VYVEYGVQNVAWRVTTRLYLTSHLVNPIESSSASGKVTELAQGADWLVHDAQYTAEELQKRRGWGHSSFDQAMQVAEMAGVKRLALTHQDPEHDAEFLERIEKLCQERFLTRRSAAKEWKSRSRTQPEAGSSREGGRAGSCVNGRHYHGLRVSAIIGPWSYRRCWYFLIASSNECVAFFRCAERRTLVSTH
jgi:Beta-lactamase superfamily domain